MPKKQTVDVSKNRELVAEVNPDALFMDDHDDAIIGVASRFGMNDVACYDYDKVIAGLMQETPAHWRRTNPEAWEKARAEADEFFQFNQIGAWLGENTPVFVRLLKNLP